MDESVRMLCQNTPELSSKNVTPLTAVRAPKGYSCIPGKDHIKLENWWLVVSFHPEKSIWHFYTPSPIIPAQFQDVNAIQNVTVWKLTNDTLKDPIKDVELTTTIIPVCTLKKKRKKMSPRIIITTGEIL